MKTKVLVGLLTVTLLSIFEFIPGDSVWSAEPVYEVLNPRGIPVPVRITPLAPRISDLNNKVVYVINTRKPYAEEIFAAVADLVRQRFPRAEVKHVMKKEIYFIDEPTLWREVKERANAVIIGPKD